MLTRVNHYFYGIISRMAGEPRRVTPRSESRPSGNVGFELIVAVALIVLGVIGMLIAIQERPYLGDPAIDQSQVLARIASAPNVGSIAVLLLSLASLILGVAWLLLRLIHRRFFAPVSAVRVWRQSFFIALWVASSAWLQLNRALTLALAVIILIVLVLIEIFLNVRGA